MMKSTRAGFVLPIALLVCVLVLLALIAFHFTSSSTYLQSHRALDMLQGAAFVDAAIQEIHLGTEPAANDASGPEAAWAKALLATVARARPCPAPPVPGPLDLGGAMDLAGQLPLTAQLARLVGQQLPAVSVVPGAAKLAAGPVDPALFYAEPVFADDQTDRIPWHLRCSLTVRVSIPDSGAFASSKSYARQLDLAITDTTPIAGEFALFSYLPPFSVDHELNGLQQGGRLAVYPQGHGRAMIRGPFLIVPEDVAQTAQDPKHPAVTKAFPYLGGVVPPVPSISYPKPVWNSWAAIPGPRALLRPIFDLKVWGAAAVQGIGHLFAGAPPPNLDIPPLRPHLSSAPERQLGPIQVSTIADVLSGIFPLAGILWKAISVFSGSNPTLGPWYLPPLSLLWGLGFGADPGTTPGAYGKIFPDDDDVVEFSGAWYFHGPALPGEQGLSLTGSTKIAHDAGAPGAQTSQDMFRGVLIQEASKLGPGSGSRAGLLIEGKFLSPHEGGLNLPLPPTVDDDDFIAPEPVPRPLPVSGAADIGLIAIFGSAQFDPDTLASIGLVEVLAVLIPVVGEVIELAYNTGVFPDASLILRAWDVESRAELSQLLRLDQTRLTNKISGIPDRAEDGTDGAQHVVQPYGMYYNSHPFLTADRAKVAALNLAASVAISLVTFKVGKVLVKLLKKLVGVLLSAVKPALADASKVLGELGMKADRTALPDGMKAAWGHCMRSSQKLMSWLARTDDKAATWLADSAKKEVEDSAMKKAMSDYRFRARLADSDPAAAAKLAPMSPQQLALVKQAQDAALAHPPKSVYEQSQQGFLTTITDDLIGSHLAENLLDAVLKEFVLQKVTDRVWEFRFRRPFILKTTWFQNLTSFGPSPADDQQAFDSLAHLGDLAKSYAQGFLPPKYAGWPELATRVYPDVDTYLKAELTGGVLPLHGIVLIRKLAYTRKDTIRYRGRGIIVSQTTDLATPSTFDANLEPANAASWLILTHVVSAKLLQQAASAPPHTIPPLRLGRHVMGTVYSDSGVAPAGHDTLIEGNLVCGTLNKAGIPSDAEVHVVYPNPALPRTTCDQPVHWDLEFLARPVADPAVQ